MTDAAKSLTMADLVKALEDLLSFCRPGAENTPARRAYDRAHELASVLPSYVLAPREPSMEMISEGFEAIRMEEKWPSMLDRVYRAMLAAAEGTD